jgi:hypothetical protein
MKKKLPVFSVATPEEAARLEGLSGEAIVAFADVEGAIRDGLLSFCVASGLVVINQMMNTEMQAKVGHPKHAKVPDREANWHASAAGSMVLGGQRVPVERPRGRRTDGTEITLDSYQVFHHEDLLTSVMVETILAGVATRRYAATRDPPRRGARHESQVDVEERGESTVRESHDRRAGRVDGPRPGRP